MTPSADTHIMEKSNVLNAKLGSKTAMQYHRRCAVYTKKKEITKVGLTKRDIH